MATERTKSEILGFGFRPTPRASHHFVVTIPRDEEGFVRVAEHFVYGEEWEDAAARERLSDGKEPLSVPIRPPQTKVEVSQHKWKLVADDVRAEFNRQLRTAGQKASNWKVSENYLSPHLGKELTLLLWAIEDADPSLIPNAVLNWAGFAPEERWWLYTTINAVAGHPSFGSKHGWRKAIGIAFCDNPVNNPANERPYFSQVVTNPSLDKLNGANGFHGNKGKNRKPRQQEETMNQLPLLAEDALTDEEG
jgi:hypothetical protein